MTLASQFRSAAERDLTAGMLQDRRLVIKSILIETSWK